MWLAYHNQRVGFLLTRDIAHWRPGKYVLSGFIDEMNPVEHRLFREYTVELSIPNKRNH